MFHRAALACAVASLCALCACSSCSAPPAPIVVDPHVVTNDQCAVLELHLDSGVTETICLTAKQLQKAIDSQ